MEDKPAVPWKPCGERVEAGTGGRPYRAPEDTSEVMEVFVHCVGRGEF